MIPLDVVKIGDRFRLCYGATEIIAMVAENNPLDMFETKLDQKCAAEGQRVWILGRQASSSSPGFTNRGQAIRCRDMAAKANIAVLPQEE